MLVCLCDASIMDVPLVLHVDFVTVKLYRNYPKFLDR